MQTLRTKLNDLRDKYYPVSHVSNFRETGQISPEEFVIAGDYLVYKFPSWSWSPASSPSLAKSYLPENKQFLVTRGVSCKQRLGDQGANDIAELNAFLVKSAEGEGDEEWVTAGDTFHPSEDRTKEVKSIGNSGTLTDAVAEEDEIPDMDDDDDDDDAIIQDHKASDADSKNSLRTYNLYIMYSQYYRTPRLYLQGYESSSTPLQPEMMMEDIVGDYKDKTVTLEPFPFLSTSLRMASIHPCKHAAVMKVLLERADTALKLRQEKIKAGKSADIVAGMEGLVISKPPTFKASSSVDAKKDGDEWEVLQEGEVAEDDEAIRVDQYIVVFLKFMASVTPGIEHDFTMGV